MAGVIAFSLFGTDDMYITGMKKNVQLAKIHYPGWDIHIHTVSETSANHTFPGAVVIGRNDKPQDWTATMWRFDTLVYDYEFYIFRDADSRLSFREAEAVREWQNSGYRYHVLRDHPAHCVPMLAGMWGCTWQGACDIRYKLDERDFHESTDYDDHRDQMWLQRYVWPMAEKHTLVHASYHEDLGGAEVRPFTVSRPDGGFIGEGLTSDDRPRRPWDRFL